MDKYEEIIFDQTRKFLETCPPDYELIRGTKVYTKEQVLEALRTDKEFRTWFVEKILRFKTEKALQGEE